MTDTPDTKTPAAKTTVSVTIDGQTIEANPGELVIAAAERTGTYIPRFCYHERMSSVGMCRMCLVEVDTGRGPMLQPSCMISVSEGMSVDTESTATKRAQEGILEFLLVNHPLDCPVCDKGGECPLQDQTMAYGAGESRFIEEKRHYEKPIPISDLVHLDRERCILCDRCTRFADEIAGDPLIKFTERGNQTQVLTFPDDPFNSYFSGNTVQICPVGALTAAPYRFKARPWDLEQVESTCTGCSVGCRVAVQSSRDELVRYLGVDIDPVNHGWLCDKGRFGFEANNSDARITGPLLRDPADDQQLVGTSWGAALSAAATAIRTSIDTSGPGSVAIIGGSRLTNEDAYAWSKLARSVIGTDNVDAQLGDGLPAAAVLGLPAATIDDACSADHVLLLGPDLKEELPVLYLRLRGAADAGSTNIVELSATATGLTPHVQHHLPVRPGEGAARITALLNSDDPLAAAIKGGSVVVVLGRSSVAESAAAALEAAKAISEHLPEATFLPVLRRSNVRGALDMGLAPGMLPGRVTLDAGRDWFTNAWGQVPTDAGLDTAGILGAAAAGAISTLVLLGADPLADFPDSGLAARGLAGAHTIIAVDALPNESVRQADIVLAASMFGEKGGTTTNIEGRVSRLAKQVTAPGTARDDWMIAAELALRLDADLGFSSAEEIWSEIEQVAPSHANCDVSVIEAASASDGVLLPLPAVVADEPSEELAAPGPERPALVSLTLPDITAPPPVDSYSLRLVVGRKLYDLGTGLAYSASMSGLAPESVLRMHPTDLDRLGLTSGTEVNATSNRATIVTMARADSGVPRGSAALAFNQPGQHAGVLINATDRVTDIRVETR
ncbi:MAG: NADH-quinone oxidoreductase subunit NuoG [Acidimicrobiales bacterium]